MSFKNLNWGTLHQYRHVWPILGTSSVQTDYAGIVQLNYFIIKLCDSYFFKKKRSFSKKLTFSHALIKHVVPPQYLLDGRFENYILVELFLWLHDLKYLKKRLRPIKLKFINLAISFMYLTKKVKKDANVRKFFRKKRKNVIKKNLSKKLIKKYRTRSRRINYAYWFIRKMFRKKSRINKYRPTNYKLMKTSKISNYKLKMKDNLQRLSFILDKNKLRFINLNSRVRNFLNKLKTSRKYRINSDDFQEISIYRKHSSQKRIPALYDFRRKKKNKIIISSTLDLIESNYIYIRYNRIPHNKEKKYVKSANTATIKIKFNFKLSKNMSMLNYSKKYLDNYDKSELYLSDLFIKSLVEKKLKKKYKNAVKTLRPIKAITFYRLLFYETKIKKAMLGRLAQIFESSISKTIFVIRCIELKSGGASLFTNYVIQKAQRLREPKIKRLVSPLLKTVQRIPHIVGFRIKAYGRFTRKQRASKSVFRIGSMPLSNYFSIIDFYQRATKVRFGAINLKIFVNYAV